MRIMQRPHGVALAVTLAGAALAAGCGGSSSTSNSVRIRSVNASVNGGTVNILINNGPVNGDQPPFGQGTNTISPYQYLSDGTSTFSFTDSAGLPNLPSGYTLTNTALTLSNSTRYTAYLIGRSDVSTVTDPRLLHIVVTDDSHSIPSGQASLRVLDAAPDAGTLTVQVNGTTPAPAFSGITYQAPTTALLPLTYVPVSPGNVSVTVTRADGTTLVPATSISVASGSAYTLLVTEPTTAPSYGLQLVQD